MGISNKPFSLLIKPASADCNQDCTYCFYLDRAKLYPRERRRMSSKVLKRVISSYMRTRQPHYIITWQGGEPTLMGVDFFEQAVKLQQKYGEPGTIVSNGIQTNALRIDDEFAKFFASYNFLIGVSLDGPEYIHDFYRKHKNGTGSYQGVMKGIDCLVKNRLEFNILTLVTQANVMKGKEVYQFLCEKGFFYHQYIECVEFDKRGHPLPYTISGEEWGNFLCEVFDEWIKSDIYRISIRLFDAILAHMVENQFTICSMGRRCDRYFVVEFNGDIYPCDFFVEKALKIGNINKHGWSDLMESPVFTNFAAQKSKWNSQCNNCKYQSFCFGDCLKNRFYTQKNPGQLSWLCKGWKIFYEHALPGLQAIAEKLSKAQGAKNSNKECTS
ncbi:MAG: anaerobic sulfatase maturase [Candidatus Aminicenantes bacterium]|nr:MAG: anaerobic sulfatase maturase [Candidatus Aminicenantes bacterium]